jgi:hypothetical protein
VLSKAQEKIAQILISDIADLEKMAAKATG